MEYDMETLVHQASALRLRPSPTMYHPTTQPCDSSMQCDAPQSQILPQPHSSSISILNTWYNSTAYKLIVLPMETAPSQANAMQPKGVYACQSIPSDVYLGDLEGERVYAWEVEPDPYIIWIEDELMIDCTQTPRCVLAMIREGFYDGLPCNCELITFPSPNNQHLHVGFKTTRPIQPGEELVYQRPNAMP